MTRFFRGVVSILILGGVLAASCMTAAFAHAFPTRSSPQVGASVSHSPKQVIIWFDADLNALFSRIKVTNQSGQVVSTGKSQVPAGHPAMLETRVKPLPPGHYWVIWHVVARDGHHTNGKFPFNVK